MTFTLSVDAFHQAFLPNWLFLPVKKPRPKRFNHLINSVFELENFAFSVDGNLLNKQRLRVCKLQHRMVVVRKQGARRCSRVTPGQLRDASVKFFFQKGKWHWLQVTWRLKPRQRPSAARSGLQRDFKWRGIGAPSFEVTSSEHYCCIYIRWIVLSKYSVQSYPSPMVFQCC